MAIKSSIMRIALAVAVYVAIPLGAVHAEGPKYIYHHATEPAVSADMGRIYFYRDSGFAGMMLEPAIKIDGVKVGNSSTGEYFYIDRPPGTYTVSTATEKEETVSVTLTGGQTVYVRFEVSMGFFVGHVSPEVVDNSTAADEIKDCRFVGVDAPAATATATTPAPGNAATSMTTPATTPAPATTPTAPATTTTPPPTPATAPAAAMPAATTTTPPATAQPAQTTPQN